jgi:hypothetical protein
MLGITGNNCYDSAIMNREAQLIQCHSEGIKRSHCFYILRIPVIKQGSLIGAV